LTPDDEVTRRIQNLVEERRTLVDEKTSAAQSFNGIFEGVFSADVGVV
jgi:hypothetical protein